MSFEKELNGILTETYHSILKMEELALAKSAGRALSISDMHLIECVGKGKDTGRTVSEIASDLRIARPSATVAVNKLEKKEYVTKTGCENDGRVVRVRLTREGEKFNRLHSYYHSNMVRSISDDLSQEEKDCLIKAIRKLNEFFKKSIGED